MDIHVEGDEFSEDSELQLIDELFETIRINNISSKRM